MSAVSSGIPGQRLDEFDKSNFIRGKPYWYEALWRVVSLLIMETGVPWPSTVRARVLRAFGAEVGDGVYIRQRIFVHFPWKLSVGDHVWIGEDCHILNLEPIRIDSHTAIGHSVFLAAAGHDSRSATLRYKNAPIVIQGGCWLMSRCFVGPGVSVGEGAVVGVGAVVTRAVPAGSMVEGNPAAVVRRRIVDAM